MRNDKKRRLNSDGDKKNSKDNLKNDSWKKKMKKALKTSDGLAHVMSVLAEEDASNAGLIASLTTPSLPPATSNQPPRAPTSHPPQPQVASVHTKFNNLATKVQLQSILKNKSK